MQWYLRKMKSKATEYKQRAINVWNEVAPFYHNRWAKNEIGPFSVTNSLIKSARIKSGYTVLDLACGTGLVTKKILTRGGEVRFTVLTAQRLN